jgi:hypothetical protein
MNEIRSLLKVVGRRLETTSFIGKLHAVGIVAAGIALLLMIGDRLTSADGFVPWMWVGPALAVVAGSIAIVMWNRRRPSESHVAVVVDEQLDLREKLSTALHCQGRDDAFAQAAIEDAVIVARDPRTFERAKRTFAVRPPVGWWVSPLIVLAAIMISFLQPRNLFARDPEVEAKVENAKLEAEKSIEAVIKSIEKQPELSKELAMGELSKQGTDPDAMRRPEEFKQDALKKLTDLNKKLDEILNGEKGKTLDSLEKSLNQLKTPEDGAAKELADSLAKGDFKAAQKALQEMTEKLQSGNMNEEEKKQLAEQLQNMAEQMEKLAQQQQQLEQALKQAGMDPALAQNPQALQQALQQNQNLNQQQKQQLQQMAQAQQAAAQMCQGMSQACQQMAQACKNGQMGQMQQGAGQMSQQLGQMEQMQQMLQQAQAAMQQCQGQCNGLGQNLNMQQAMQQWSQKNGANQGNWGRAAGGQSQYAKTPTATKLEKGNVQTVEGDIIAKQLFDGQQIRGESKAKLIEVAEAASKGIDEAQSEDHTPRVYQDAQKRYFGEMEKLAKATKSEPAAPKTETTEPAKDAEPSKSE